MSDYLLYINEFLDQLFAYGPFWVYMVIFAACFIENITPPFPGDSFIVVAGGLVAVSRLDPILSLLVVVSGGMCSVTLIYLWGRGYGREFFLQKDFKYFPASEVLKIEEKFISRGPLLLLVSRFVVGFRVLLVLTAGISRFPLVPMIIYSGISYMLFGSLLIYLGFKLVENYELIERYFQTYNFIAWPIVIVIVIIYIIRSYMKITKGGKS